MEAAGFDHIVGAETRLTSEGSPFALRTINIGDHTFNIYRHGPQSLPEIAKRALRYGRISLLTIDDTTVSFDEVFQYAASYMHILTEQFGVQRGDRIGIAINNKFDAAVVLIAVVSLGATAVFFGHQSDNKTPFAKAAAVGCSLILFDSSETQCPLPHGEIRVSRPDAARANFGPSEPLHLSSKMHGSRKFEPVDVEPESNAIIAFTSGTTGPAKSVILTHRGITTGLMNMMLASALAGAAASPAPRKRPTAPTQPCVLLLAPLSHAAGYTQLLLQLMLGGRLVLSDAHSASEVAAIVEREKVKSIVGLTPEIGSELLDCAGAFDLSSLTVFHLTGYAVHDRLVEAIARKLPHVTVGTSYGLTETNGAICALAGDNLRRRPNSCGRVVPTVEIRILDGAGHTLPHSETGEIWLRGAMLFRGYNENVTDEFSNGWFKTGDVGYLTEDRFLTVVDRCDNIVQYAERQFSCTDVEYVVGGIDGVAQAATIVSYEPNLLLTVAVVPEKHKTPDISRIQADVAKLTGCFPLVILVSQLSRNAAGKIDLKELRLAAETAKLV